VQNVDHVLGKYIISDRPMTEEGSGDDQAALFSFAGQIHRLRNPHQCHRRARVCASCQQTLQTELLRFAMRSSNPKKTVQRQITSFNLTSLAVGIPQVCPRADVRNRVPPILFYRFHATISVWVKHHKASGSWPQARQEAAIAASSERVAMPYSRDFSAMLECSVRSA